VAGGSETAGGASLPALAGVHRLSTLAVDGFAVVVALLALIVLAFVVLAVRRRFLLRGNGTIDCSLRRTEASMGRGWVLGVARYEGDVLKWYRVFSFSARPREVVSRRDLTVRQRRMPEGPEALAVTAGAVVVEIRAGRRKLELAMTEGALTGFLAWLESAPPGAYIDHIT
jgi:hypothetical protein